MKNIVFIFAAVFINTQVWSDSWFDVADEIVRKIDKAEQHYSVDNIKQAKFEIVDAYWSIYDQQKMKSAVQINISSKHAWKYRQLFNATRKLIDKKQSIKEDSIKVKVACERLLDEFDLPFEQYELLRLEVLETITQLYSINNPQVRDKLQRIDEFFKLIDENKNNNLINFANNNTSFLFVMFVVLILVGILYYVKRDNKQKKLRDFHPKRFKLR